MLNSKIFITFLTCLSIVCSLLSCNDETGSIGGTVMPSIDHAVTSQKVYSAFSKSVKVDSMLANTSNCYLGKVTDPETGATTTCNFLAQFYNLENYKLPEKKYMNLENGKVVADSVTLYLQILSYYGDSLNSMKISVKELDSTHVMEENKDYYSNFNPSQYISTSPNAFEQQTTFSVIDYEESDSIRNLSSYSKRVTIKLPKEFGSRILNLFYEHPEYFKNAYTFIHKVHPGFYVKTESGNGTLLTIDVSSITTHFKYFVNDSTFQGVQRIAATEEVLQNNTIENSGIQELLDNDSCTYIKTPAGIFTEIELPIDSIYLNHEGDSINCARIVFQRQNNNKMTKYSLPTNSSLLLLQKSEANTFFAKRKIPDNKKQYIANFNKSYNSYTYDNIGQLIAHINNEMIIGAGITSGDSKSVREAKAKTWKAAHPDWNKVLLVPVKVEVATTGAYSKIYHDFSLSSTKLVGGKHTPINISVVYSRFGK